MDFKYDIIVIGGGHAGNEAPVLLPIWALKLCL
jgi:tRNA U34 5-carboxymethylaminomethyl modifying enzyme MnmG/GidA